MLTSSPLPKSRIPILGLGPAGTYTGQVVQVLLGILGEEDFYWEQTESNEQTIQDVPEGGLAVYPIFNKYGGEVQGIGRALYDRVKGSERQSTPFHLLGWYSLKINHVLAAKIELGIEDIEKIYSHPQGIIQCKRTLDKMGIREEQLQRLSSTTAGISLLRDTDAVICSEEAANAANVEILERELAPNDNETLFAVFGCKVRTRMNELLPGDGSKLDIMREALAENTSQNKGVHFPGNKQEGEGVIFQTKQSIGEPPVHCTLKETSNGPSIQLNGDMT